MRKVYQRPKADYKKQQYVYAEQKDGWVTFSGGKKKTKLRKYVADMARKASQKNGYPFSANRDKLIESYDKDGLKGIQFAYIVLVNLDKDDTESV